ncbi:hypothetical protein F2P81_015109 [Scophthalmus maximus]|uniref:C2H2-type domain-containing protein n=1 Tax=Scophthalmus maximus TaxID=52904 RepID=A0A6A4SJU0_SCOMX|nr:hypothetical protein F2P81_015109 [Scophthalmus maximus]
MDTMTKSALSQISGLVDEDSAELRLELSRLLLANSALADKVESLECELTIVRSDVPNLLKRSRTVGVQTVCYRGGDPHGALSFRLTAALAFQTGVVGIASDQTEQDGVLNNSSTSGLFILQSVTTLSDYITVNEIREESGDSCQEETLQEHEESASVEPEQVSVGYSANGSTCSLSLDQEGELVESAAATEEPSGQLISINDTEEAFSTHIIPIEEEEEEEEDDDVQFVEESQQEPPMNAAGGPSNEQQTSLADNTDNSTALDKDSQNFIMLNMATVRDLNKDKFTCQICSRTFYHKGTLTHHMRSHKSNFCNICKQHFPHRYKLNSHTCVSPVPSQRVSRSCELCGKTFANQSALSIHYVVHTGEKPYRCSFCGKGFTQKGNLKCHLRIHTGERPFHCVKCGKTFTQKVNLNHHLMAHRNREVVGHKPND